MRVLKIVSLNTAYRERGVRVQVCSVTGIFWVFEYSRFISRKQKVCKKIVSMRIHFKINKILHTSKPNERSCRILGNCLPFFAPPPPPCYSGGLQNGITFFLLGPCWVWKSMLDKSFHFICFQKNFGVCLFPTPFTSFFQKMWSFLAKIAYIGGKQTNQNFFFKNEMFECLRCFCIL